MDVLNKLHNFLFKEIADPRVYNWPFMADPWMTLSVIGLYLCSVYIFLPSFMSNRRAYDLKGIIRTYNVLEITSNVLIIYGLTTSGWSHYTFGCQSIDYSEDKMALTMAAYMWWTAMLKMAHLTETIIFSLRKKYNQINTLHVYHHASTVALAWILVKYFPGGMASFIWLINSFIHILMYTYYTLSSFGSRLGNILAFVKPKLTLIQIFQLILIIIHASQTFLPSCQVSSILGFVIIVDVGINLYFFIKFYYKSYVEQKKHI